MVIFTFNKFISHLMVSHETVQQLNCTILEKSMTASLESTRASLGTPGRMSLATVSLHWEGFDLIGKKSCLFPPFLFGVLLNANHLTCERVSVSSNKCQLSRSHSLSEPWVLWVTSGHMQYGPDWGVAWFYIIHQLHHGLPHWPKC